MIKKEHVRKTYRETSHFVRVSVTPMFTDLEFSNEEKYYIWDYQVRIENQSKRVFQLRRRYWKIIDCYGKTHEIMGEGVVGEQPVLKPGDIFEYTSAIPLQSPSGIMEGIYFMVDEYGKEFDVKIPAYSLENPYQKGV